MRDPKRIDRILKLLEKHWKKYPDLRLGQIIQNFNGEGDVFYLEDSLLEEYLKNDN